MTDPNLAYAVPIGVGLCVCVIIAVSSKHLKAKWLLLAYLATLVVAMTVSAAPKLGQPMPETAQRLVTALELTYGPWFYLYVCALTTGRRRWYGLLFLPAAAGLAVDPGVFTEIQDLVYVGLIVHRLYRAFNRSKIVVAGATATLAFLVLTFVLATGWHYFRIFPESAAYPATIGAFVAIAAFHLRYPEAYYEHWQARIERSVDEQTRKLGLSAADLDDLLLSVQAYLQRHQPQRDPELNLPGLAAQLGLAPAQLSFLLNNRVQKRFPDFVNELRAAEARELFASGSQNITEVMHAVGFRSKSTFYKYFKSLTGTTPSEFLKGKSSSA